MVLNEASYTVIGVVGSLIHVMARQDENKFSLTKLAKRPMRINRCWPLSKMCCLTRSFQLEPHSRTSTSSRDLR